MKNKKVSLLVAVSLVALANVFSVSRVSGQTTYANSASQLQESRQRDFSVLIVAQRSQLHRRKCLEYSDRETSAICLVTVGNSLGAIGELKEAEQAFRDAIRILPGSKTAAHAYTGLGSTLGRQERYADAIAAFQAALAIDPSLETAWSDLGVVYSRLGRLDDAIQAYRQCISVGGVPEIIDDAYLNLTYLYLRKKDAHSTKQSYGMLVKRNPKLAAELRAALKSDPELAVRFRSYVGER